MNPKTFFGELKRRNVYRDPHFIALCQKLNVQLPATAVK
jgi:hypothetical protein